MNEEMLYFEEQSLENFRFVLSKQKILQYIHGNIPLYFDDETKVNCEKENSLQYIKTKNI